jgi:ABC-type uncharacterized transport system substrate-binding protein
MTLEEQLAEKNTIKTALLAAMTDNVDSGSLLAYTTNGTKVVYEGATATYKLIRELDGEIAQITSLINNNIRLASNRWTYI